MFLATLPQTFAVAIDWPLAHELFHASTAPEDETKQPAATPEYNETAAIRSG